MVDYSVFKHEWTKSQFVFNVHTSNDYKVYLNGKEIPVYTCRISAYPINVWWPGHQRPVDQSEVVSYVNLVSDEEFTLEIEPLTKTAYERIMVKPYSKGVKPEVKDGKIQIKLKENGGYVLELDDYHGLLYIFNNAPVTCENPENVTYYYGPGVHFAGKITLKSNESIYVHKDALVYGCIYAEGAENITVRGNGIFDDSAEERICDFCYEPYTNGNIKIFDCKNIKIEGVGFVNSAIFCVSFFNCFDIDIKGMNVFGQWRYNTDGVDVVNCQRVTIKNSFIHSFDDSITVKAIDQYCHVDNRDMLFENCVLWCDWGRTCEIGLETNCMEYANITFRSCDILRGGTTCCDIQNGDCAYVHGITFENIRVELESFYTEPVLQDPYDVVYDKFDSLFVSEIVSIQNRSFREQYAQLCGGNFVTPFVRKQLDGFFTGVNDITVKDITVYCDEKIFGKKSLKEAAVIKITNYRDTTEFKNIKISDIKFNGKRLKADEITVITEGKSEYTVD